jgi:GTPase SAR1 family protein
LFSLAQDGELRVWDTVAWQTAYVLAVKGRRILDFTPLQRGEKLVTLDEKRRSLQFWAREPTTLTTTTVPIASTPQFKTAKIALVGDTGVGKSTLAWRLTQSQFTPQASTHGQQCWIVPGLGGTLLGNTNCEAVLWDFAGQQDYRLVHSLFLDDVELALILFDPTDEQEPFRGAEFWIGQLAPTPELRRRIILVGARLDRGAPTVTREEIEAFAEQNGITGGYVGTSAKTGEGFPELIERIKAELDWPNLPLVVATPAYGVVRTHLTRLKEAKSARRTLISIDSLLDELRTAGEGAISRSDILIASKHLSAHGYVALLHSPAIGEVVLLKPDLLINLASSLILEARRNARGLGVVEEVPLIRGGYNFDELVGLSRAEQRALLEGAIVLFVKHNVCFRERLGSETFLVFPALINLKRPRVTLSIETEEDTTYRVRGEIENLYSALVVLLGYTNTFTRTNQWQNQAQYEMELGQVCGFQQIVTREGEIEFVPPQQNLWGDSGSGRRPRL